MRLFLAVTLWLAAPAADAGVFHRCDDGSRVPIYQSAPCASGQRTVATHRFQAPADAAPRGRGARGARGGARDAAEPPAAASRRSAPPRTTRSAATGSRPVAYACRLGGVAWLQAGPCRATASPRPKGAAAAATRLPQQQELDRHALCLQLRQHAGQAAPGESLAAGAYRRNLLRERGRC